MKSFANIAKVLCLTLMPLPSSGRKLGRVCCRLGEAGSIPLLPPSFCKDGRRFHTSQLVTLQRSSPLPPKSRHWLIEGQREHVHMAHSPGDRQGDIICNFKKSKDLLIQALQLLQAISCSKLATRGLPGKTAG